MFEYQSVWWCVNNVLALFHSLTSLFECLCEGCHSGCKFGAHLFLFNTSPVHLRVSGKVVHYM